MSPKSKKSWIEEFSCLSEKCNFRFFLSFCLWLFLADQNALRYYRFFFSVWLYLISRQAFVNYVLNYYYHCSRLIKSSSFEGHLFKILVNNGWLAPKLLNRWKHCSLKSWRENEAPSHSEEWWKRKPDSRKWKCITC